VTFASDGGVVIPARLDIMTRMEKLRHQVHEIIFEADTPAGKVFDVCLLIAISISVALVLIESIEPFDGAGFRYFYAAEWCFTILFTIEYALRLWSLNKPVAYARSFFGIVDLLAILPTYIGLLVPGAHHLLLIRALRALRLFRIFKMLEYIEGANMLLRALWRSRQRIIVFAFTIFLIVTVVGAVMYVVEGEDAGYDSIPMAMYWAIVTITTVGYGDVVPQTWAGRMLASFVMLLGYAIIAIPTGIITAEVMDEIVTSRRSTNTQHCRNCGAIGHQDDAKFCRKCGTGLHGPAGPGNQD